MRRAVKFALLVAGALYASAWVGYVAKSALGIDIFHDGIHHGPIFPGSDRMVAMLRMH